MTLPSALVSLLCLVLVACGSNDGTLAQDPGIVPTTTMAASPEPAEWNRPIEPATTVADLPTIDAELPVVSPTGRALGGGLLDAVIGGVATDDAHLYLSIGRAAGCAEFEHLALTPGPTQGTYQLFYDTDNTCEAYRSTGYRTALDDITPAADGSITILDTNGTITVVTLG